MTKVCYQVSQSNWLDSKGLGKRLSKTPDKKLAKNSSIHRQSIKVMIKKDNV